ncbi:uncharacterized protein MELLADRAFT_94171 [Melampsora larici-populina 98AG31]|uniref:SGNH hydrolase-type esterase domain-containing protein n=1 Tax=Melampsora larici-populina (strain 98AG31 / pathotype 3-4-7) TaxID=747676 RepID=F4S6R0_MELLP|nr:uncharacterized protein MELLADRAFT_94171 [Melampsora larici-populina 98AG31]EGF99675.1 hypothetical protein MELLADRAFT_94171 [Melampsora larici-populina 98AG31]
MILLMLTFTEAKEKTIDTSPLKLAVKPKCGTLESPRFNNFNTGINLDDIKTIYGFGDSFMANGQQQGGVAPPLVPNKQNPKNPKIGGRASNGMVYIEQFGKEINAVVRDYARGGASVSHLLSPTNITQSDMIEHVQVFLDQHNNITAASTLVMISYGINDWASASRRGEHNLTGSARKLIHETKRLLKSGFRNVVVLSPPMISEPLEGFNNLIWNDLKILREKFPSTQIGYVDFSELYTAIFSDPQSFGYQHTTSCLKNQTTIEGACSNPDVYLHYLPGHPQKLTHGLMAEWAYDVLTTCTSDSTKPHIHTTKAPTLQVSR